MHQTRLAQHFNYKTGDYFYAVSKFELYGKKVTITRFQQRLNFLLFIRFFFNFKYNRYREISQFRFRVTWSLSSSSLRPWKQDKKWKRSSGQLIESIHNAEIVFNYQTKRKEKSKKKQIFMYHAPLRKPAVKRRKWVPDTLDDKWKKS